jgi:hypothetical protein
MPTDQKSIVLFVSTTFYLTHGHQGDFFKMLLPITFSFPKNCQGMYQTKWQIICLKLHASTSGSIPSYKSMKMEFETHKDDK